ncbi:MAG: molybdopterin-synthase adenylyltransferase MoeB [Candidatus Hydrogenedentota bacterium]|nr:MAG: molybdopterin-synthase adenylyltransferase MoeB [Candidatus Hydrogenedentota bacterium]
MIKVQIPTALRRFTNGAGVVEVEGSTVGEVLKNLAERYPEIGKNVLDAEGNPRNFVKVFLEEEDIAALEGLKTTVSEGQTVLLIPSIAGGGTALTPEELKRYSRHIILPEVGKEGQEKLKSASVLIIGAGGLGSPLALYLAAAGIGRLGLVDFDVVDETNLQRQVLYVQEDVGRSKCERAAEKIRGVNPNVEVKTYEERLSSENAMEIGKDYDIIIDGTDNFPTRYLANDISVFLGKPNVYGSIFRFEGQASVFDPGRGGPCYRCLYPEPPPPGMVPSCAEGGVLGVLPGIIGVIQATEAIKILLGVGETLVGRLLLFDALSMRFRELRIRRNPECPVCGEHPTITSPIDYEQFCGIGAEEEEEIPTITVSELKERIEKGDAPVLVDVREPFEYEICNLGGKLIPLGEIPERFSELDPNQEIVVHCKMGGRSAKAVEFLLEHGYKHVKNLAGGINAWREEIDPDLPAY